MNGRDWHFEILEWKIRELFAFIDNSGCFDTQREEAARHEAFRGAVTAFFAPYLPSDRTEDDLAADLATMPPEAVKSLVDMVLSPLQSGQKEKKKILKPLFRRLFGISPRS